MSVNKVILLGRLTADPELSSTPQGVSVAKFTIAVDRNYTQNGERKADFINCVAWRGTGEFISKYFTKGKAVAVVGEIQTRSWDAPDGTKRYATEVIVNEVSFAGDKKDDATPINAPDNALMGNEDELPF